MGCRRAAVLLAAFGSLVTAAPAAAETFRVNTTAELRRALVLSQRTQEADTIIVAAGTYVLPDTLRVESSVSIEGAGARQTIIDGNGAATRARAFDVQVGPTRMSGMTVRNGGAAGVDGVFGGNLRNGTDVRLTLERMRFTNGNASSGGAIANEGGTLVIERSLIDDNQAVTGGGDGGGIANIGIPPEPDGGGSIPGIVTVRNTTIVGNRATLGGGISQWRHPDNRTLLENVTVARNVAGVRGGGFIGDDPQQPPGTVRIRGSLVARNVRSVGGAAVVSNCQGQAGIVDAGGNLEDATTCGFRRADDRQGVNPELGNLVDRGGDTNVLEFGTASPARDIGPAACATTVDQRGVSRPRGSTCDAGAFELEVEYALTVQQGGAASARVGTPIDVRVRLLELGKPLAGATVTFTVEDGPDTGLRQTAITDAAGDAGIRLPGGAAGSDAVVATFTDAQGRIFAVRTRATWTRPLLIVGMAPGTASGPVGGAHSVTATATEDGAAVMLRPITFTVVSGPHAGETATSTTDGQGRATFTYTGRAAGTDRIRASLQSSIGETVVSDVVERAWTAIGSDRDRDGVSDPDDNCPDAANAGQADRDDDRIGDACDTALPPGDLPVVVGEVARVRAVSGQVFVKLPKRRRPRARGSALARVAQRAPIAGFVPLKGVATVPMGSVVDARKGTLAMTTAATFKKKGKKATRSQTGRFAAALFMIRQARKAKDVARRKGEKRRRKLSGAPTDLVLRTPPKAARACARTNTPRVGSIKGVVRMLSGSGTGTFRTVAAASTTTIAKGIWIVQDRCGGTLTEVGRGLASVYDVGAKRTVDVRGGQSYLAKARLFGARVRRGQGPKGT